MGVAVKVCGLAEAARVTQAVALGARYVGFVFYPPSPRAVDPATARELADLVPSTVERVGLFVDPTDAELEQVLRHVQLELLQLHGYETPERVTEIALGTGLRVMKAMRVAEAADLEPVPAYEEVADLLLFDARPAPGALPGGNGLSFDWRLLANLEVRRPWLLAGGLHAGNVAAAVAATGATGVDVSSGVESRPGVKDPARLEAFLQAALAIGEPAKGPA